MMKKKTQTIKEVAVEGAYEVETSHNEGVFKSVLKNVRPDIFVLMDMLDTTGVNPYVIYHVIRSLNNIALGNKYGSVLITIENGIVTFVRGEESVKLNEAVLVEKKEL